MRPATLELFTSCLFAIESGPAVLLDRLNPCHSDCLLVVCGLLPSLRLFRGCLQTHAIFRPTDRSFRILELFTDVGRTSEYRSITPDNKSSAWAIRFRALFAFMTTPFSRLGKHYREGRRRTKPARSSGVERVNDPRSGTVFRAECAFIGVGGTSTR